jgi:hypothetical protein
MWDIFRTFGVMMTRHKATLSLPPHPAPLFLWIQDTT